MSQLETKIFKNGEFIDETWAKVPDGDALPANDAVSTTGWPKSGCIVSLARWRNDAPALIASGRPIGVAVAPTDKLDRAGDHIDRLSLIVLAFPKFTDGRAYSQARTLREQWHFKGELRATGDVLLDQIPLMLRCGFDSFEIAHPPTIAALERGHAPAVWRAYQSTAASLPALHERRRGSMIRAVV